MFTGVAGALLAIANEATNYTIFSAQASANVVLQTFIGGAGTFFGPALGAAIMTFFARVTSDLTRSWLLYQGLIFVLVMLFAPRRPRRPRSPCTRARLRATAGRHLVAALSAVPRGRAAADRRPRLRRREHPRGAVGRLSRSCAGAKGRLGALSSCSGISSSRGRPGPGPFPSCCSIRGRRRRWLPLAARAASPHADADASAIGAPQDGQEHGMSTQPSHPRAWCSRSRPCRKSFGETQIIRGVDLTVKRGQRHAPDRAQWRGQVDAVQPDLRPLRADLRRDPAQRAVDRRAAAARHQPARPVALVPDHQRLPAHERGGEPAHLDHGAARPPLHAVPADPQRSRRVNDEVDEYLEKLRLTRRRDDLAGDLAYSEQRILEIGMALATESGRCCMLDEPTAGMSREETAYIVDADPARSRRAGRCWSSSTT